MSKESDEAVILPERNKATPVPIDRPDVVQDLTQQFVRKFGAQLLVVEAPGRVNLIGEHIDYNEGFVLPAAIQFQTAVAIAAPLDGQLVLQSQIYAETKRKREARSSRELTS